jgi:hypothetical protein
MHTLWHPQVKTYCGRNTICKFWKIYICFVFSAKLGNISWENYFLKRNTILGNNYNIKRLNRTLSTNYNGKLFFTIKRPRSWKSLFVAHHHFKMVLLQQKIDIALVGTFGLFFTSHFSTFLIISLLISSSKFFTITEWSTFTCFLWTLIW